MPLHTTVVSAEPLTLGMVRIVVTGDDLEGFGAGEFTDHYVKLQLSDGEQQRTRTYTVQNWDAEARELTIDFVVHGDVGVAGPWARAAKPGDPLQLRGGPGGAYAPRQDAPWHLMVGDAAVIPAIAASLRRIPAGVPVHVLLAVPPQERQELTSTGDLALAWLPDAPALEAAVAALDFPAGEPHVFLHGEASLVRNVRRHLVAERGLPAGALSASGYWKQQRDEEGWRADKAEWNALVAADAGAV